MRFQITRRQLLAGTTALLATPTLRAAGPAPARKPNIIVIYTDDLGYGDIGSYGATAVKTPNIDRLAAQGLRFTNAHAPAATCTPSRYALLTGEYAWRREGAHILPGDAPALIAPGKPTLPAMLRGAGYRTAVIGKWHLGLGDGHVDWNKPITPGPLEIGFDHGYFIPATLDRVPCVFIEDHDVVGLDPADPIHVDYRQKVGSEPTGRENPEQLRLKPNDGHDGTIIDGVSRIGFMSGGRAARWDDEEIADRLVAKANGFIEAHRNGPFFLYFATNEIHVPRLPAPRFRGASGMGTRGDSIVELDWSVGELMKTLARLGLERDTLVIFSSDNGPVLDDGYDDDAVRLAGAHRAAGVFRSGKYSIFDGGLRVPMIVRWPATIAPGRTSAALIDHVDLFATLAVLTGQTLSEGAAVDSFDVLPALLGRSTTARHFVIEEASVVVSEKSSLGKGGGSILALVEDNWKLIQANKGPAEYHGNDLGSGPAVRLYDLAGDPAERTDLASFHPARAATMFTRLTALIAAGRTRPA